MDSRESLVDLVFGKCALVYGRDFAGKWEGMNLAEVKADWIRELGGWLGRPAAIKYALEHLPPDKAPNVLQFRALCNGAPAEAPEVFVAIAQTPEQKLAAAEIKRKAIAALKIMGSRRPRAEGDAA